MTIIEKFIEDKYDTRAGVEIWNAGVSAAVDENKIGFGGQYTQIKENPAALEILLTAQWLARHVEDKVKAGDTRIGIAVTVTREVNNFDEMNPKIYKAADNLLRSLGVFLKQLQDINTAFEVTEVQILDGGIVERRDIDMEDSISIKPTVYTVSLPRTFEEFGKPVRTSVAELAAQYKIQ